MRSTKNAPASPAQAPHDAEALRAKGENLDRAARYLREAEKIRAAEKCSLGYGNNDVLDTLAARIEAAAEVAHRSARPIAIGDMARVDDENRPKTGSPQEMRVVRVGPKRAYLRDGTWAPQAYDLETGTEIGHGYRSIDDADLHRIRRDLMPKPKATKNTKNIGSAT